MPSSCAEFAQHQISTTSRKQSQSSRSWTAHQCEVRPLPTVTPPHPTPRLSCLVPILTFTRNTCSHSAPAGETIPIRLFLGGFELTPTFRDVNKKFSTRYYLNLVLIDEENRRYFKQQEITVYRDRKSVV